MLAGKLMKKMKHRQFEEKKLKFLCGKISSTVISKKCNFQGRMD